MNDFLKATASDLHLCQRCPRLLAYQKKGERKAWKVGIDGSGIYYGKLFHSHIAGAFHSDAARVGSPHRAALTAALKGEPTGLKGRLLEMVQACYFDPFLVAHGKTISGKQIMALAQATEFWVGCLSDFLAGVPSLLTRPEKQIGSVFCKPETTLKAFYPYSDGMLLRVRGRYDGLLFDPDAKQAALFEFKAFKASDPVEELSQALVYAWLIHTATGVMPQVCLVYLEDSGAPLRYSAADVGKMTNNLEYLFEAVRKVLSEEKPLPPPSDTGLCRTCPYEGRCDGDWGNRKTPDDEGRDRMSQLMEALRRLRIVVEDVGIVYGTCFIRLKVKPDIGKTTVSKIEKAVKDLQIELALSAQPMIQPQAGYVSIDVPRASRQILTLRQMMEKAAPTRPKSEAAFPLGLDINGKVFWVNLSEPTMTSVLVGGTSGSGKSVLLRALVAALAQCSPPGSVCFTLIDPKRVTFTDMKNTNYIDEGQAITDTDAAMKKISDLVAEMEERYVKMEEARVVDIEGYNSRGPVRLKRRVLLIDEYADMIVSTETRNDLEKAVQRISQKGRAAGLHLVLATQRPDAKVVTPIIKANLQLRIALKVTSKSNSQIILGEGEGRAQYLLGHGDMLVGGSVPLFRLQGALP